MGLQVVLMLALPLIGILYLIREFILRSVDRYFKRVPNGPTLYPIIGAIGIDTSYPHKTFQKWHQQYGRIYSVLLGSKFFVAISDMDLIRRVFKDERYSGRDSEGFFFKLNFKGMDPAIGIKGIVSSEGEIWKTQRRFALSALRDFGFGKERVAEIIAAEAMRLRNTLRESGGKPVDQRLNIADAVGNVVSALLFSESFTIEDDRFRQFIEYANLNLSEANSASALELFPFLRFFPPFSGRMQKLTDRLTSQFGLLRNLVDEHRKSFDPDHPRDYLDAFFCVQQNGAANHTFTDAQLLNNLADLYIAGFETTTTFIRWAITYLIHYPDIQRKVHQELHKVIGQSRLPTYEDRSSLPYTEAVIAEVFRFSDFLPFLVPHKTTEITELEGYTIPKGTLIMPLVCAHFRNSEIFGEDVDVFRPERFLDPNGELVQKRIDEVIQFSVGKRACLGEPLARMESFVFFATILQNFTLLAEDENHFPSLTPTPTFILGPPFFKMRAVPFA